MHDNDFRITGPPKISLNGCQTAVRQNFGILEPFRPILSGENDLCGPRPLWNINGHGRASKYVLDRLTGQVVKSGAMVVKSRCHFNIFVYYIHLHVFSSFLISR